MFVERSRSSRSGSVWRFTFLATIYLIAGAALNVLVAWGIALVLPRVLTGPRFPPVVIVGEEPPLYVTTDHLFGMWSVFWWGWKEPTDQDRLTSLADGMRRDALTQGVPEDSQVTSIEDVDRRTRRIIAKLERDAAFVGYEAYGWPVPAMHFVVELGWQGGPSTHGDIEYKRHIFGQPVHLPATPEWPGFAINTCVYAGLLVVIGHLFTAVRRAHRRGQGLCPRCKYDLRHDPASGCPECGWRRSHAAGAT